MKFGIGLPTCREGEDYQTGFFKPSDIVKLAQTAERLGFDSIWSNDHLTPHHYLLL